MKFQKMCINLNKLAWKKCGPVDWQVNWLLRVRTRNARYTLSQIKAISNMAKSGLKLNIQNRAISIVYKKDLKFTKKLFTNG